MPLALEARPAIAEFLGRPGGVRAVARCSLFERLQFDALVVRRLDEHRVPPFPREDSRSHVARRRTSGKFLAADAPSPGSSSVSQPPSRVGATRPLERKSAAEGKRVTVSVEMGGCRHIN